MVCLICRLSVQMCVHHKYASHVPQPCSAGGKQAHGELCLRTRSALSVPVQAQGISWCVQGGHVVGTLLLISWPVGCCSVPSHRHEGMLAAV